jgi:hypothetical protein
MKSKYEVMNKNLGLDGEFTLIKDVNNNICYLVEITDSNVERGMERIYIIDDKLLNMKYVNYSMTGYLNLNFGQVLNVDFFLMNKDFNEQMGTYEKDLEYWTKFNDEYLENQKILRNEILEFVKEIKSR